MQRDSVADLPVHGDQDSDRPAMVLAQDSAVQVLARVPVAMVLRLRLLPLGRPQLPLRRQRPGRRRRASALIRNHPKGPLPKERLHYLKALMRRP